MTDSNTGTASGSARTWGRRLSRAALLFSAVGLGLALGSALLSWFGVIAPLAGFRQLFSGTYVAFAGLLTAIVAALVHWRRGTGSPRTILLALALALPLLGYVVWFFAQARAVPPIHDISTDLADPPTFARLTVRADNLAVVPDGGRADLARLRPAERVAAWQREAYGDLAPLRVAAPVAATTERIAALARSRGWDIAVNDPALGRVEATDTVSLYRFKDDIVFRVRPDPARAGASIVDARSVSRVGVSDVGVNARRIRAAFADLAGSASPTR